MRKKNRKILWVQPIIQADLLLIPKVTYPSDNKMKNLFGISDFNPSFITKLTTKNEPTGTLIYACLHSDKQALQKYGLLLPF